MYYWLIWKRRLESLVMFPLILLGKSIAALKATPEYEIYFFFPFYHIGGAEKVHYQIAQAFSNKRCVIYFTRTSRGQSFLEEFKVSKADIKDVSKYTDNKFLYPINLIFRGLISHQINRQKCKPIVFNGQSNFGYKLAPWVFSSIPQIDLIHALCSFSYIRIPYLQFYSLSVTVSKEIVSKHAELYYKYKISSTTILKLGFINYGVDLPVKKDKTDFNSQLRVLYVGRGSEEKRVYLVAQIARMIAKEGYNFRFSFLGDVKALIPDALHPYCNFLGTITEPSAVDTIYRGSDVLVITSYTESGPLVAVEAMARGLAVISTPVGIINDIIKPGTNGFVFSSIENETTIIHEAVDYLSLLARDIELRKNMAFANTDVAYSNFALSRFQHDYRRLFASLNDAN